jgi:hypothetical protein
MLVVVDGEVKARCRVTVNALLDKGSEKKAAIAV